MSDKEPTWVRFLEIRRELINEWRLEGKSCTEIACVLSMDPGQVFLISQVESGEPPDDAVQAIREGVRAGLLAETSRKNKPEEK